MENPGGELWLGLPQLKLAAHTGPGYLAPWALVWGEKSGNTGAVDRCLQIHQVRVEGGAPASQGRAKNLSTNRWPQSSKVGMALNEGFIDGSHNET